MFHQGNLQSGIALAIQEQKLVGVFVHDGGSESAVWEDEWLRSGWLSSLLEQKAVILRIEAGSAEADYLSAFCTISSTPTFVMIQNGRLQEQLASGVNKDEFINRIRKVLGAPSIPGTAPSAATPPAMHTPEPTAVPLPVEHAPQSPPEAISPAPTAAPSSKAKGKQKATEPTSAEAATAQSAQQAARDALRKKKQEEKEELARIKARIEADKAERKAMAEARKAERERLAQPEPTLSNATVTHSSRGSQAKQVHLNVRLFDGRTIRSTFPRTAKLQDDVRPWVDRESAAAEEDPSERHQPYIFKQILAPLPSRELSVGDEAETLGDIDLAPSATLVLVPIKGYTDAYAGGTGRIVYGAAGNVMGLVGGVFNLAGSAIGYVGSTLSSVIGAGGTEESNSRQEPPEQTASGRPLGQAQQQPETSSIRVRTLADQRAREPRNEQLYNGNQLNFEPRDEDTNR